MRVLETKLDRAPAALQREAGGCSAALWMESLWSLRRERRFSSRSDFRGPGGVRGVTPILGELGGLQACQTLAVAYIEGYEDISICQAKSLNTQFDYVDLERSICRCKMQDNSTPQGGVAEFTGAQQPRITDRRGRAREFGATWGLIPALGHLASGPLGPGCERMQGKDGDCSS
ncbi:hypothetical protein NDU88_000357 [Pleurodeles waltl]|uniref:Uncharacterized protein n=1 Tax=Pleurodeles waltl TaxID=8319 RepID=A0AAV7TFB3_PLEWA|nr:hypothetical protein NDU88_000357 [Pleurodeles waltl]